MNKISKYGKVGLIVQVIAGFIMVALVCVDKPIPDLVAWLFAIGMIITLVSSINIYKNTKE